jgi:hypothetical protein
VATAPKTVVGRGQVKDQAPAARRVLEVSCVPNCTPSTNFVFFKFPAVYTHAEEAVAEDRLLVATLKDRSYGLPGRAMGSSFSKEVRDCCNSRNGRSAVAQTAYADLGRSPRRARARGRGREGGWVLKPALGCGTPARRLFALARLSCSISCASTCVFLPGLCIRIVCLTRIVPLRVLRLLSSAATASSRFCDFPTSNRQGQPQRSAAAKSRWGVDLKIRWDASR